MYKIYVLKLTDGKYYVGKTKNVQKRYQKHLNAEGAEFTKKYKPVGIQHIIENCSNFDEDKYTKVYMHKYGIENVRGGSYCKEILDKYQIKSLKKEIWGANGLCIRCGRKGHFIKKCYAKADVDGNEIEGTWKYICEDCNKEFDTEKEWNEHELECPKAKLVQKSIDKQIDADSCIRCGRHGHLEDECYASTHISGGYID